MTRPNCIEICVFSFQDAPETPLISSMSPDSTDDDVVQLAAVQQYKLAVTDMLDQGEDSVTIEKYKKSVLALHNLKQF